MVSLTHGFCSPRSSHSGHEPPTDPRCSSGGFRWTKGRGCCPAAAAAAWPQGRTSPGLGSHQLCNAESLQFHTAKSLSLGCRRHFSQHLQARGSAGATNNSLLAQFHQNTCQSGGSWPTHMGPVHSLPCALGAAMSSLGHQLRVQLPPANPPQRPRNLSPACLCQLQGSVSEV